MPAKSMDELTSLCKRRGFIFQSNEIYGGQKGFYDYGPMGVELKNNIKQSWWRSMVYERDNVEGLDSCTIGSKTMFKYSGHVDTFNDPLVECKDCHARMRADHMKDPKVCENCGSKNVTEPRMFNMMFKTNIGPMETDDSAGYLRPETAQHIFANFKNVVDTTASKLPFGIAQIGRAYRNEIVARNFIFRTREFEQMELEFFVRPGEDEKWHEHWLEERLCWWEEQGIGRDRFEIEDVAKDELAHYAKRTYDLNYKYPHGPDEVEGIANRTDYDLGSHTKEQDRLNISAKVKENTDSNTRLAVQDIDTKEWIVPYVIEPSLGLDRCLLAIMNEAYTVEDLEGGKQRTVLKFKPHLAPIKAAVIPLAKNKEVLVEKAKGIKNELQKLGIGRILFENSGNVGKAYRKHDEVGTPLCITVDFETIEDDDKVTVRDRDSMEQKRVAVSELSAYVREYYAQS